MGLSLSERGCPQRSHGGGEAARTVGFSLSERGCPQRPHDGGEASMDGGFDAIANGNVHEGPYVEGKRARASGLFVLRTETSTKAPLWRGSTTDSGFFA